MIKVYKDEFWPVYCQHMEGFYEPLDTKELDIPQNKLDWINKASSEFWETQRYLEELYNRKADNDGSS